MQFGDSDATLTKRLTMAGFSFTMIAGAVLVAKALVDVVPYTTFIFASFVGALIAFVVRWRSNRTVERDARKNGTRPSP